MLLNVGAIFMGTALTIRDLIGERAIFLREQAVGLSTTAYLLAKVCVYSVFAIVQSGIVTAITLIGKVGPGRRDRRRGDPANRDPRTVRRHGRRDCVAAATVGLALSALAKSNEQIMPLLVVAIMSQLVFSGGMIPVTGRVVLDQMSWVTPARWGFAATASTVDLIRLVKPPADPEGLALEAHAGRVAVQHGHAGGDLHRLPELRALQDPPQGRLIRCASSRKGPVPAVEVRLRLLA